MRFAFTLLVIAAGSGMASEAAAQAAQCFNPNGTPYGPVYRMENPSPGWVEWVRRYRGMCRAIAEHERNGLEKRPQVYPSDYLAWQARVHPGYRPPGAYPGPGRPGYDVDERDWNADPNRAAFLVGRWLANQGRGYAQVVDTGRVEFLYERQWRIFFARWTDGGRTRVAVRYSRRDGGTYMAMQSYGGGAWSQPQPIGQ
jgi:hypothetical protein